MTLPVAFLRKAITKTTSNEVWLTVGSFTVNTATVPHNKAVFTEFCKRCKNYGRNGGCPPYAPDFSKLQEKYRNMLVIWVRMDTDSIPAGFANIDVNRQMYLTTNYVTLAIPAVIRDCYNSVVDTLKPDFTLWESGCKVCKKSCGFKVDDPALRKCKRPKDLRFSLEATGVDVDGLMRIGAFPLYWFEQGKPYIQTPFTVKVMGLLYKQNVPQINVAELLVESLQGNTRFDRLVYSTLSIERSD